MATTIQVLAECLKTPGRTSIWSPEKNQYVCTHDPGYKAALAKQTTEVTREHAPINATFKLVFLAAFGGTILFVLICVGVHLWTGGEMPSTTAKLIDGMFDMAKIGFGAIVGLLGGKTLRSKRDEP